MDCKIFARSCDVNSTGWLLGSALVSPGNNGLSSLTVRIGSWKTGRENVGALAQPDRRRVMNEAKTRNGLHGVLWFTALRNPIGEIIGRGVKESNQRMRDGLLFNGKS